MRIPHWRNAPILVAVGFTLLSVVALGFALSWRSADQRRLEEGRFANCQAIEVLKAVLRPGPFDLAETKQILADLNVDPESEKGRRLITRGRENNARERKQLAPKRC